MRYLMRPQKISKMPSEQTPLLTTVRVASPRSRYPHNVLRRFCTIALSSTLIWFLIAFFVTLILDPDATHYHPQPPQGHRPGQWTWPGCPGRKITDDQLKQILLNTPDAKKAEEWSRYYTAGAHMAGQNYSQAVWTKEKWEEFGIKASINAYDVYLNRPVDHRLALLHKTEKKGVTGWKVAYEASLKEDVLEDDPTTGLENSIPTFHGYSGSGNVTAPVVYVNYGTYQDFEDLLKLNVSLKGKIAIARYGGIFRGLKVKRAQELGMVGTILYSDPGDDGEITEEKGLEKYPTGPARQASSVQRGSTEFLSIMPGDPTTPGYPSKPGVPRGPTESVIPVIPSIPISYQDALPILKALNGHGPKAKDLNKYWTRNAGLGYKGVDYNIGPSPDDVVVNLHNEQDYITTPIWNVIGIINGTIPDEVVIVGNHRDAWIIGGAGDPNSGSAVMNEVIRSFGEAVKAGWKPLRTIVFGSWDGEEYGLVGSTEWVEEYLPWLSKANVAYVNIDVGVRGKSFHASAAPLLNKLIFEVTAQVASPNQTVPGQTVADVWDGHIGTMGSGSDFTAFQDFAGIASLDVGFNGGEHDAVYHYHSNYDSFWWMSHYGDPGFVYHRTMTQVLSLLTARLADSLLVPFSAKDYADSLGAYVKKVEDALHSSTTDSDTTFDSEEEVFALRARTGDASVAAAAVFTSAPESFSRLYQAVFKLSKAAIALDARAAELEGRAGDEIPWWKWPKKIKLGWQIRKVNTKYKLLERKFLYSEGLDGRNWFKHVVFAPGLWTGYAGGKENRCLEMRSGTHDKEVG
jgi:N-acetylated-alpha-linked acidic dipeptidase